MVVSNCFIVSSLLLHLCFISDGPLRWCALSWSALGMSRQTHFEIYHSDAVAVITLDPLSSELVQSLSDLVCLQVCVGVLVFFFKILVMTVTT